MSLPPGFLDELRTRTSLAQVVGRKVIWDARKSNQGKGDMWAPCPFHQEKTASFHVDDRKGFYYCFGCHAKGDAINFVRETESLDFMDTIRLLAQEAGMEVPRADPKEAARADRRSQLAEVMEAAVRFYRLQLKTAAAAPARDYLAGRGFDDAALDRFEIGFAADARQGLFTHLTGKGVSPELIIDAGLCAQPDDGGAPYDRFRGRILFPIRDGRGRAIALGGRAMDPNARAKYLNSPETDLFDKGRTLFNLGPARVATGKGQPLIVAEGYMDVIALVRAGFEAAVAPLGTAITDDQLRLMWRIHPEPVIALDGDTAGQRAAERLIDLALPHLAPERALRFVILTEGKDPDDIIRTGGRAAMAQAIDGARPLLSVLWQRETEARVLDSPERRAGLDKRLREVLRQIQDPSVRNHYAAEIKRLRGLLLGTARPGQTPRNWRPQKPAAQPTQGARASMLAQATDAEDRLHEAVILATLITQPKLIAEFEADLETVEFHLPEYRACAAEILRLGPLAEIREKITETQGPATLENLFSLRHVQIAPGIRHADDPEMGRMCLAEEFAKIEARRGRRKEMLEAEEDITRDADEGLTWRLGQAAEAHNRAQRSQSRDKTEYDIAPSGARMDREERKLAHDLFDSIAFGKGPGGRQK